MSKISNRQGKLVLLIGPTGGGKTAIAHKIIEHWPSVAVLKSFRTRPKRPSEQNDQLAAFVTNAEFSELERSGFFLHVERYGDEGYGLESVPAETSQNERTYLSTMSPEGAMELRGQRDAIVVLCRANEVVLRGRLEQRIAAGDQSARSRLAKLEHEIMRFSRIQPDYVVDTERTFSECLQLLVPLFGAVEVGDRP